MSEFHDPELRQELGRLSGPYPDDNIAFAAWQRRVGQVRRRRIVAWATAAALALVVGTVGAAALQSPGRHSLVPSKAEESSTAVTVSIATTEAVASSTESTEPEITQVAALAPETTPGTEVFETSVPEVEATASGDQPAIPTSTKVHSPTTPPPTTPPPTTHTFSGIGGSITVRQNGDQLTVVATKPAAGFHAGRDGGSRTRVEVTFTSDSHQTQITVKLEGGAIKPAVTEKSENHDTSPHQTTVPDSSGGDPGGDGTNG